MPEQADARDTSRRIAAIFEQACRDELDAPKPGNVHVFADGHQMSAADFESSAAAAAGPLATTGARVGARILGAVEASRAAVGTNTNLGIILLCAPLAVAAETASRNLQASLTKVLQELDRDDAELAFRAIALASPGGLGRAERHDVREPALVTLREAMGEAADRDRIARQYVTDFADVFGLGAPLFAEAVAVTRDRRLATLVTYLRFLAAFPDSHIARKYDVAVAERVCRDASKILALAQTAHRVEDVLSEVLAWDATLKRANINPGTSADLTVATIFADRLRTILPTPHNSD